MTEYEVLVETINPCGGAKHCIKEFMDVETNDPIAWVKANGRFPILDTVTNADGDLKIITGDEAGNFVHYTFTE